MRVLVGRGPEDKRDRASERRVDANVYFRRRLTMFFDIAALGCCSSSACLPSQPTREVILPAFRRPQYISRANFFNSPGALSGVAAVGARPYSECVLPMAAAISS